MRPPTAILADFMRPVSSTRSVAAQHTRAKWPWRNWTSENPQPSPLLRLRNDADRMRLFGGHLRAVFNGIGVFGGHPAACAIAQEDLDLRIESRDTTGTSPPAFACARQPMTVPRLRTCGIATQPSASESNGMNRWTTVFRSIWD